MCVDDQSMIRQLTLSLDFDISNNNVNNNIESIMRASEDLQDIQFYRDFSILSPGTSITAENHPISAMTTGFHPLESITSTRKIIYSS